MNGMPATEIRANLSEVVSRVAYGKERIALCRRGKVVVVLVPPEDAAVLEAIENREDLEDARKALALLRAGKESAVPWEEARKDVGAGRGGAGSRK